MRDRIFWFSMNTKSPWPIRALAARIYVLTTRESFDLCLGMVGAWIMLVKGLFTRRTTKL